MKVFSPSRLPLLLLLLLQSVTALNSQANDGILSSVSVLTIHVSDTNTHEKVFRLLVDVLRLPIDYGPEIHGGRRYAAVYAGNLFIEPCGPFVGNRYPVKDFKAVFYGLNCVSGCRSSLMVTHLDRLGTPYERPQPDLFRVRDPLVAEGIHLGITGQATNTPSQDREKLLSNVLAEKQPDGLGFQNVKEILVAYPEPANLEAWGKILGRSNRVNQTVWRLDKNQTLRFVQGGVPGIRGIVCQVSSLKKAQDYLNGIQCKVRSEDGRLQLDPEIAPGLAIWFAE
jgi:hypothetical protein